MSTQHLPLRILHITFNMGIGGTEQVIRQLVTGLPKTGFINSIACIDGSVGAIGEQVRRQGVDVFSLARKPGFDVELIKQIRNQIRERNIDIVHCHQYTPWVYGLLASIGLKTKVVFTEHGRFHPDRYRYKAMLVNPLLALKTDKIIAISGATKTALSRYEFIPEKCIEVIYNGIKGFELDLSAVQTLRKNLGILESELVLGTVARLDPVKNQSLMLDAFAVVLEQLPNSKLLMVGDGPDRNLLEKKAKDLGIDENVIFTGFKPEPVNYLALMDLFLLSSHTEGTSMTLLEAMSLGIPTVATNVGGNPEIVIHGETGLLTEPDNIGSFAKAIRQLAGDRSLMERFSNESKRVFHKAFSQDRMIDSYTRLYSDVKGLTDL